MSSAVLSTDHTFTPSLVQPTPLVHILVGSLAILKRARPCTGRRMVYNIDEHGEREPPTAEEWEMVIALARKGVT